MAQHPIGRPNAAALDPDAPRDVPFTFKVVKVPSAEIAPLPLPCPPSSTGTSGTPTTSGAVPMVKVRIAPPETIAPDFHISTFKFLEIRSPPV